MFGIGKSLSDKEAQREQEIEQSKEAVREFLRSLHETTPEQAEAIVGRMKAHLQNDKILPFDSRNKAMKRMRTLECEANMRAADRLIHEAIALVAKEQMRDRGLKLAESRKYFGKACTLGVDEEWRKAYQRLVETTMLSGGIQTEGATRAKPKEIAPKTPNRAKPDE